MGSTRIRKILPSEATRLSNPTIAKGPDDQVLIGFREIPYKIDWFGRYQFIGADLRSHTWLSTVDKLNDLSVNQPFKLVPITSQVIGNLGLEDPRLFRHQGLMKAIWCSAERLESPSGKTIFRSWMVVGTLKGGAIKDLIRLPTITGQEQEKNWAPFIDCQGGARFVYDFASMTVVEVQGKETRVISQTPGAVKLLDGQQGSSQLHPFQSGWLCVTHRSVRTPKVLRLMGAPVRFYTHHFVYISADYSPVAISKPFVFKRPGVEFCSGLLIEDDQLFLTFSVRDQESFVMAIDIPREWEQIGASTIDAVLSKHHVQNQPGRIVSGES